MPRLIAVVCGLFWIASPALAQEPALKAPPANSLASDAPEKLLSPTSQLYIRWDGITAHNEAYKKSFWGGLMAGPTGDSIRTLLSDWPKYLGSSLLTEPLLEGKPPEELKKNLADIKNASKFTDLIIEKGSIISVEVRGPTLTTKGVGQALGSLFNGESPGPQLLMPDVQLFVIVPNIAGREEVLFATLRLLMKTEFKLEPFEISARKGFKQIPDEKGSKGSANIAFWVEGKHFVLYAGSLKFETALASLESNAKKGGITGHPLFHKCRKDPGFESVTRGFVDTGRLIALAKGLAGPFVPGLGKRLDDLGITNLKSITFNSGFEGKESRATYEFELIGERKGLAKILKQQPIGLKDLPPLPPDMSHFSALRIDPQAAYETTITALEATLNEPLDTDEEGKSLDEKILLRREQLMKELDKQLGMNIKDALIPHLGDKLVIFNSPSEGLSSLGTVVCLSLKDGAKVKHAVDRIHRVLDSMAGASVKTRKKKLLGVEIRELYSPGFLIFTPTYAIVDDWLVFSLHPQPVQGFIFRAKGELPVWKPDAATALRIAKLPADACGLQYCDPRATVQNLCCVGPLALNTLGTILSLGSILGGNRSDNESSYEPFDIGLMPNAHILNKHLFPNLTVTRDDGKAIRIELYESFSLPFEFIGLEPTVVGGYLGLSGFVGAIGKR